MLSISITPGAKHCFSCSARAPSTGCVSVISGSSRYDAVAEEYRYFRIVSITFIYLTYMEDVSNILKNIQRMKDNMEYIVPSQ